MILIATPKARQRIVEEMERRGAICKRCRIISRTDELTDGFCNTGTGCSIDIDHELLNPPRNWSEMHAQEILPKQMWETFVDTLPRRGEHPDTPPPEEVPW